MAAAGEVDRVLTEAVGMLRARRAVGRARTPCQRAPWTARGGLAILGSVRRRPRRLRPASHRPAAPPCSSRGARCSRRCRPTRRRGRATGCRSPSWASTCATWPWSCPPRARPASSSARRSTSATSAVDVTFAVDGAPTPATVVAVDRPARAGCRGAADEDTRHPGRAGHDGEMTVTTDEAGANVVGFPCCRTPATTADLTSCGLLRPCRATVRTPRRRRSSGRPVLSTCPRWLGPGLRPRTCSRARAR